MKVPSTSRPCTWNAGKKRRKNPNALHKCAYKSSNFSSDRIIGWDPRPAELHGKLGTREVNMFWEDLSRVSAQSKAMSMWELSLVKQYDDFRLTEERKQLLQKLTALFEQSLVGYSEAEPKEIEGTIGQNMSFKWFSERRFRITASKCKPVFNFGKEIIAGNGHKIVWQIYKWMRKNFWLPERIVTMYMRYGIEEEPKARLAYINATRSEVRETGMWINGAFSYLGASPDGLILDSDSNVTGLIEIKCLKILNEKSVKDLLEQIRQGNVSSTMLGRQCFTAVDDHLILRSSHMYYHQMQLQLLITELLFCDFVLYSPKGPPSIQRILPDTCFQNQLKENI